ncbi:MAG: RNA-binding cell elongation regulator Jag/EloR [Lachnospiraceae bacterium]|nr:RNA-binding cell elongation regulator Jag/EloR [Lachnospiraceae bacterium]
MQFVNFKAKTVQDAIMEASIHFGVASDEIEYEVVQNESKGLFGIFNTKEAIIKARVKEEKDIDLSQLEPNVEENNLTKKTSQVSNEVEDNKSPIKKVDKEDLIAKTRKFCDELFGAMKIDTKVEITFYDNNNSMNIDLSGEEMGILIGKRGQTLDALQYIINLYVNKESNTHIKLRLDTENYRARRRETLENLAKNIAYKVRKTKKPVTLEPMSPYERRIIHSAIQNDPYVYTKSEGEEPYRKVVVLLKNN